MLNQDGSNFQKRLVDSGLWTQVLVNYYTLNHVGPITISGQTSPDKLKAAMAAMYEEIAKFDQPGYFTEAELEPQKQQRAVGTAMGLERASGFAHELGFWWSVDRPRLLHGIRGQHGAAHHRATCVRTRRSTSSASRTSAGVLLAPRARRAIGLTEADMIGPASASGGSQ